MARAVVDLRRLAAALGDLGWSAAGEVDASCARRAADAAAANDRGRVVAAPGGLGRWALAVAGQLGVGELTGSS